MRSLTLDPAGCRDGDDIEPSDGRTRVAVAAAIIVGGSLVGTAGVVAAVAAARSDDVGVLIGVSGAVCCCWQVAPLILRPSFSAICIDVGNEAATSLKGVPVAVVAVVGVDGGRGEKECFSCLIGNASVVIGVVVSTVVVVVVQVREAADANSADDVEVLTSGERR